MESSIEVILFTLAGEKYAIETKAVGEVFPADSWTALPGTPDFILGATNYCGNIVPIVDLRPLFGLSAPPPEDCARVILLEDALSPLGILAETVTGIEIIDRSEIHPVPATIGMARSGHILGLAPGHCALLDSVAIRGDESLFV
jgi:purine-binding chemotaxis protein CheW